ncbi:MAG TPA: hypothetical protein VF952_16190 [Chloroflexia bacterium]|jgi:hypothetical protein
MAGFTITRLLSNIVLVLAALVLGGILQPFTHLPSLAQAECRTFPETGKAVCGRFLEHWQENGGVAQHGYPISDEFQEISELNGQTYTVQYFERAVFEKHPENQPPYDVLLSQLGTMQFRSRYPGAEPKSDTAPRGPRETVGQFFSAMHYSAGTSIMIQSSLLSKKLLERFQYGDPYYGLLGQHFPAWKKIINAPRNDFSGNGPVWVLLLDGADNTVAVFTLVKEDNVWKIDYAQPNALSD